MTLPRQHSAWRVNHRRKRRRVVYMGARIAIKDRPELIDCRIIDVSPGGARLDLPQDIEVPDHFVLILSHDMNLRRQCSVVWRSPPSVGVEFIPFDPLRSRSI